jgi:hypothetical protein
MSSGKAMLGTPSRPFGSLPHIDAVAWRRLDPRRLAGPGRGGEGRGNVCRRTVSGLPATYAALMAAGPQGRKGN